MIKIKKMEMYWFRRKCHFEAIKIGKKYYILPKTFKFAPTLRYIYMVSSIQQYIVFYLTKVFNILYVRRATDFFTYHKFKSMRRLFMMEDEIYLLKEVWDIFGQPFLDKIPETERKKSDFNKIPILLNRYIKILKDPSNKHIAQFYNKRRHDVTKEKRLRHLIEQRSGDSFRLKKCKDRN